MGAHQKQGELNAGFEPSQLVNVAMEQAPDFPWLPHALATCSAGQWRGSAYIAYVPSDRPNHPGSEWQFETCVVLEHETLGQVVVDILQGQRIGGIEFVDRLLN